MVTIHAWAWAHRYEASPGPTFILLCFFYLQQLRMRGNIHVSLHCELPTAPPRVDPTPLQALHHMRHGGLLLSPVKTFEIIALQCQWGTSDQCPLFPLINRWWHVLLTCASWSMVIPCVNGIAVSLCFACPPGWWQYVEGRSVVWPVMKEVAF